MLYDEGMINEYWAIVRRNLVSPLVIAIAALVVALLLLGEQRDAWFISVVITVNVLVAIVQEIRARLALHKLEILTAPKAIRLQGGEKTTVAVDAVGLGDTLFIAAGDQIPVDGVVLTSQGLECDESLLTGEATTILKEKDATVYAGSVAMAGEATIRVSAIGTDTKAGKMTAHLRRYVPEATPLQKRIARTIQILTYVALGLSAIIIVVYLARGLGMVLALKTVTAAGVAVVPEGLLLASTLLLAFGALKLAQNKVLPQKLSAIEAMALLDVLCVDKTGTLTSDEMQLETVEAFADEDEARLKKDLYILAKEASSNNPTGAALSQGLSAVKDYTVDEVLAFSSARKMSAIRMNGGALVMGAPEMLKGYVNLTQPQQAQVDTLAAQGRRVMIAVRFEQFTGSLRDLPVDGSARVAGMIVLSNALRAKVRETVSFLQGRGVSIRVISGDNPKTVQYVAESAGISNAEQIITGAELAELADEEWAETVERTTIFARVLPEQKQRLIETFQQQGKFTGMVGDGVNDALALKQSNLGVAMFAGAAATRRVADIILLDNSFTSLPIGMRLGNRIMQAIELMASLFFHKVMYGIVLLTASLSLNLTFPFLPRHITFMNVFLVVLPSVLWTLFPPETRERVDPKAFWKNTALTVLPIAVLTAAGVLFTYWWLQQHLTGDSAYVLQQAQTLTALAATIFGISLVFLAPRFLAVPVGKSITRMRIAYAVSVVVVALVVFAIEPLRSFLDFGVPNLSYMLVPGLVIAAILGVQFWIAGRVGRQLRGRSRA